MLRENGVKEELQSKNVGEEEMLSENGVEEEM